MKMSLTRWLLVISLGLVYQSWAQPLAASFIATSDSYVRSGLSTTNYGTANLMNVGYSAKAGINRSLAQFDLSSIPANAVILSARLYIRPTVALANGSYSDQELRLIQAAWAETSVTYATQPAVAASGVATSQGIGGWRVFEVIADVQAMVNGTLANNGWMVKAVNETVSSVTSYSTREETVAANRPRLDVSYYLPLSLGNPTITHATETTNSDGGVSVSGQNGSGVYTYQWINGQTGAVISSSSNLTNVPYGWYGLTVTDTYGGSVTMAYLVGVQCEEVSIYFNPGPNFIDDAFAYDLIKSGINYGNNNYGTGTILKAERWTNSGIWYSMKSLLKFRLWMDNAFTVNRADLYLDGENHSPLSRPNTSELRYINANWDEMTVTYNTLPAYNASPSVTIPGTSSAGENDTLDIIPFWNSWKTNNTANYGMLMQLQSYINSYTRLSYYSSDYATPANRPAMMFDLDLSDAPGCSTTPPLDQVSYSELKKKLDAGYGIATQDKLKFTFDEEYQIDAGQFIQMRIYNEMHEVLEEIDAAGTSLNGTTPLQYNFDDMKHLLDLSTIPGLVADSFYTLEVTTTSGQKLYLRFIYKV